MNARLNELPPLQAHVEVRDDRAIVRLIGPIAAHDVETLRNALERAEASGAREIVADQRQVPILSSRGVAALLGVACRLGAGRRLVLARPCDMVRHVCQLSGLVRFVVLCDQLPGGLETRPE